MDLFGCTIAGQAWREGILSDANVLAWARSKDRWKRRLALVATVPLNSLARGGTGDAARTLRVCRALVGDRDDMVVKAISWALRELAKRDPKPVVAFIEQFGEHLAARVIREVQNKLTTGLKNPATVGPSSLTADESAVTFAGKRNRPCSNSKPRSSGTAKATPG